MKTSDLLDDQGPLSRAIKGFEARPQQQEMLALVEEAYASGSHAIIEAGTGTGKSLAYLIPALLRAARHGETTLISTHTISLQEQLLDKDLPLLLDALDLNVDVVLVKGMSNYLCLRRLKEAQLESPLLTEREAKEVAQLAAWSEETHIGSRSELPLAPLRETWERVCAESDSCTHAACPHYSECFFYRARQEASDARILIANHHLLFSDLAIRAQTENYTESSVIPPYNHLVLDEAHHLEAVATDHFASRVSRHGLLQLIGRLHSERGTGKLKLLHKKVMESDPEAPFFNELELDIPAEKRQWGEAIEALFQEVSCFQPREEKIRFRASHLADPRWLENVQPAAQDVIDQGERFLTSLTTLVKQVKGCEGIVAEIKAIIGRLEGQLKSLQAFVFEEESPSEVRWIEPGGRLVCAKLDVSRLLTEHLFDRFPTVVCCSATLAAGNKFDYIKERLGIVHASEGLFSSPFNYGQQMELIVPEDLPLPEAPGFLQAACEAILASVKASRGSAFVLFTSYQMLKQCAEMLAPKLEAFTLLCQGDESRHTLLDNFRKQKRCILFGTDSFWEGVDVVGEALRLVIIVKLPFKVPTDPLFQARSEKITEAGGSAFFDYALPQAIVKFKQGFGRLIRTRRDHGCVVCLDTRLINKPYGKKFIKSLPSCPVRRVPSALLGDCVGQGLHRLRRQVFIDSNRDGGVRPDVEGSFDHVQQSIEGENQAHHGEGNVHPDQESAR